MSVTGWMQLAGPRRARFSRLRADLSEMNLHDLAHMLARTNRFAGATRFPLSVAQHCLLVSELAAAEGLSVPAQMKALLHDGHEAFLTDLPTPVKAMFDNAWVCQMESMQRMIDEEIERTLLGFTFEIDPPTPAAIRRLDLQALALEARAALMPAPLDDWHLKLGVPLPHGHFVAHLPPSTAADAFAARFDSLRSVFCEAREFA